MYDIVALGESLIDFTPNGTNEMGMLQFVRNPGGAPANVLAMFTKLGGKTAFIGKVGNDEFGKFLTATMKDAGIDVSAVAVSEEIPTTLAIVQLTESGDRSFSFYRKPGADIMLSADDLNKEMLTHCNVFHFGSVSLTDEPSKSATLKAAAIAKDSGAIISYDPNYRPLLWKSESEAKKVILEALKLADIVKVSYEEMVLLTGKQDLKAGAEELAQYGAVLVIITMGSKGAYYHTKTSCALSNTYDVKTVDTTGAGDAFFGAMLWKLKGKSLDEISKISADEWNEILDFANAAGSLTTTKKGAIPAMPNLAEIEECMKKVKKIV
jgi:fructokinase